MGLVRKLAILAVLVAVVVGVVIVKFPVPNDIEEPNIAKAVSATVAALEFTAGVLAKLKVGSRVEMLQTLTEYALSLMSINRLPTIRESWETIAGTPVMVFEPTTRVKNGPAIIYMHGGGWTWFSPHSYRYVTQNIAKETNYMVFSIDYPRAPKHVYPAQKTACVNVVRHVLNNADKWGIDKNKIVLAGDSAGGQLTAAVSLELKDTKPGQPKLAAQIPIYPALQFADFQLPSYQNDTHVLLTTEFTVWFSQLHAFGTEDPKRIAAALEGKHISAKNQKIVQMKLKHADLPAENFHKEYKKPAALPASHTSAYKELEKITMDPGFSPLLADNFKNTPPTLIFTMYYDPLRDDGYLYAKRLRQDGVHVEHINYHGWHAAMPYHTKFPFFRDITKFVKKVVEGKP